MSDMLVPLPWEGLVKQIPHESVQWLKQLPNNTFCALWQRWPDKDLPLGYSLYVVSFHLEVVDINWITQQCKNIKQPIIILSDSNYYNVLLPANVHCYTFYHWHKQLEQMRRWFGIQEQKQKKYKFSTVCNRITQSKLWVTTKLLDVASNRSLIALHPWLEQKNVHNWQLTGNPTLDSLTELFKTKYIELNIDIDKFDNQTMNKQSITGNPWQPLYTECAVHFTNESFHYSYTSTDCVEYIHPGPFITEKTLKCLFAGTTFVPTGQFDTYKTLSNLGFNFEYCFNTTWDNDPGNLTRFEQIIHLIDELNAMDIDHLVQHTKEINQFNQNHITSGNFFQICEKLNNETVQKVIDKFQIV